MTSLERFLQGRSARELAVLTLEEYLGPIVRSIPGFEGFFLRWLFYRLVCSDVGTMGHIYTGVRLVHGYGVRIGNKVNINYDVYIDGRGKVDIGDYALIGPGAKIISSNHQIDNVEGPMTSQPCELRRVKLEEDVWIGAGAIILPGVTVGRGGVVAAGSVVTGDVAPFSVVGGIPAKEIRKRKLTIPASGG